MVLEEGSAWVVLGGSGAECEQPQAPMATKTIAQVMNVRGDSLRRGARTQARRFSAVPSLMLSGLRERPEDRIRTIVFIFMRLP